ncbi:MAG: hypothetical protein J7L95_08465, partial [Prolixibacteraceae bacterium]|nr:hypothetical protein [Prolixibacteraceae bacterium]
MKNSCKILIITLLTFLPVFLSGNNTNNEKDSIHSVNLYRAGRELALIHHFMESTDSLLKSLELRKKIYGPNAYRRFAGVYRIIATNYKNIGLTERAIEFSNFAEEAYKKGYGENYRNIAYVYLNMGNIYRSKLNFNEALRYYNQMINILLTQPDINFQMLADDYYSIAEVYFRMLKFKKAIEVVENQIDKANIETKIYYFDLLGGIYQELRDTLKAENSYKKAIESAIRFSNEFNNSYNLNVAYEYLNFASFLIKTGKTNQAGEMLNKAYPIIVRHNKEEGEILESYYRRKAEILENKHIESKDLEV